MIGGDGREYGPVTADQLREWIAEQRLNGATVVQPEGSTEWLSLSALPEFAAALAAAWESPPGETAAGTTLPPSLAPSAESPPEVFSPKREREPFATGGIDVAHCLGRGWTLLTQNFLLLASATFVVWAITALGAFATCVGGLVSLVVSGPLYGGLMLVFLRLMRGQPTRIGDVFSCFNPRFLPLMLVSIVTSLLSGLGLALCVVPGLILKVLWAFSLVLVADREFDFTAAMSTSWRVAGRQFLRLGGLMLVTWLPVVVFEMYTAFQMAGFLTDTLGPVQNWTLTGLQGQLQDFTVFVSKLEFERQLVFLLNLPFALAAILYAYEDAFGPGTSEANR